jgi:pimeloyl-ACP methyl ester carboxylesterase
VGALPGLLRGEGIQVRDADAPPDPRLGTTSLLDYAGDLEGEVRKLEEPPVIMGHSMGGLLALMLAARGLAGRLVMLTPASPRGIVALRPSVVRSFWSGMTRWGFWRKPYRQTYGEAVYSMMHLLSEEERRRAYERFVFESGRASFEIGFWPLDGRRASAVDFSRVTCPVLVVSGGRDRITPAPVVRRTAGRFGKVATYREFPGHAHWVLGEPGWEEVAGAVAEWLG